jgi:hypothetical protein
MIDWKDNDHVDDEHVDDDDSSDDDSGDGDRCSSVRSSSSSSRRTNDEPKETKKEENTTTWRTNVRVRRGSGSNGGGRNTQHGRLDHIVNHNIIIDNDNDKKNNKDED